MEKSSTLCLITAWRQERWDTKFRTHPRHSGWKHVRFLLLYLRELARTYAWGQHSKNSSPPRKASFSPSKIKQYNFVLEAVRSSDWNDNLGARTSVLFLAWFVTNSVSDLGQDSGLAFMLSTPQDCRQHGQAVLRVWIPRNLLPCSSQNSCVGWHQGYMKHEGSRNYSCRSGVLVAIHYPVFPSYT